jgi:UDP-N-acetylmuramoyl-tripeptide--D-alanyl-D-alanine ligase
MHWTIEQVARALGAAIPSGLVATARATGVSIDSRTTEPRQLFFAIHGPRHDGHDYVPAAFERGALAAVVSQRRVGSYGEGLGGKLIAVEDPRESFQKLARLVRDAWSRGRPGRRLAAVTGSAGKTTTKEILAALLAARMRVLKSEGNLNNEYGVPLSLLKLEEEHDAAVIEFGMNHPGEIARLAEIAAPDVGVVTCVAPVHLEFFPSVEEIALAKRELIERLSGPDSVAVLNADDARVLKFRDVAPGRVQTFGLSEQADFRAAGVLDLGLEGTEIDFVSPRERAQLHLSLPGRHNVSNALAALAAASVCGAGVEEARHVLPWIQPADRRGEVLRYAEGFSVLNDSYNSNPVALAAAVDLIAATHGVARRVLAAGEMLELGPSAPELHREAGRYAARRRLDWIFGVQGLAREIVRGAVEAGHPSHQAAFFESSEEAGRYIAGFLARGDLLLVKGSRGVKMEGIIDAIEARHALVKSREGVI